MVPRRATLAISAFALALAAAGPAAAQEAPEERERIRAADRPAGFDGKLTLDSSFMFVDNDDVVGQNDGTSLLLSGALVGGLDYIDGRHELRNTLSWHSSWARTPVIDQFVKNNDVIQLEDLYYYYLTDWMGPFGRLDFKTSVFATNRVTAEPTDYRIDRLDGATDARSTAELRLADPVNPFELSQTVGFFAEPYREQPARVSLRLGFGAREMLSEGVLVVQDDPGTDPLEVQELDDVIQGGFDAFAGVAGEFPERRISYRVGGTAFVPVINSDDTGRTAWELTRLGATAGLNFNVFEWLSLSYDLMVLRDPQLLNATQVQNSLLLSLHYAFFERERVGDETAEATDEQDDEQEEEPPTLEEELAAAEARAQEAAREADQAKERARELEEQLERLRRKQDQEE